MNYSDKIIDGRAHAQVFLGKLAEEVAYLRGNYELAPKIIFVLVGNDPSSITYVRNKVINAEATHILSQVLHLPAAISQDELLKVINELNDDESVHGIIVQMPVPEHISAFAVLSSINPHKDVDGFHPYNVGLLQVGAVSGFAPCTPLGCVYLLKHYLGDLSGMNAVVIGRSQIVGRPASALLLNENCSVTICHSMTRNLQTLTKKADIVISAMGKPSLLGAEYFNENATVLDVGITQVEIEGKLRLMGDIDFTNVVGKVKYLTPVPGGVGPMTVAFLLSNTVKAAKKAIGII